MKRDIEEKTENSVDPRKMDKGELRTYLSSLDEQMDLAARNLEFEKAAEIRDQISRIRKLSKLKG